MSEDQLKTIFEQAISNATHDFKGYEKAKKSLSKHNLNTKEYDQLISQITEYLGV